MLDDSGRGGNVKASELGGGGAGMFHTRGPTWLLSPHLITAHLLYLDFKCPIFQVMSNFSSTDLYLLLLYSEKLIN